MTKTITTIKDATHEWVREMNAFPRSMIEKLMEIDIDDWQEVTPLHEDCRVYSLKHNEYGYIIKYNEKTELYTCNADRFKRIVDSVEARSVSPEKIAKKTCKS